MESTLPQDMKPLVYDDAFIRKILDDTKVIAMVGASDNPARPSFLALKYLRARGYTVHAVNPGLAGGGLILGEPVYATLAEIPGPIDMVDIFRHSAAADGVVDDALRLRPLPAVIWMQLSVRNDEAAARAQAAGLRVVMNRCPKIEYGRLTGEIGWMGVNSRSLSSRRATMMPGFQKRRLT